MVAYWVRWLRSGRKCVEPAFKDGGIPLSISQALFDVATHDLWAWSILYLVPTTIAIGAGGNNVAL